MCAIITSVILVFSCNSVKKNQYLNFSDGSLIEIIVQALMSTPSSIIKTDFNRDISALKLVLNDLELSDTILIRHSSIYGSASSIIMGYSFSFSKPKGYIGKDYIFLSYDNKSPEIFTQYYINDYVGKEEFRTTMIDFFNMPKVQFIERLKNDKENIYSIADGDISIKYIIVYKIAKNRYSYDVYNLTN